MFTDIAATFFSLFTITHAQIFLYSTHDDPFTNTFDCLYTHDSLISYCQRLAVHRPLHRHQTHCQNHATQLFFRDLIDQNIHPQQALRWSWTIEMADLYASFFYNTSLFSPSHQDLFVCNCTQTGTFGKYCEYQLTHHQTTFGQALDKQFNQKKDGDSWNTQRYGNIICYETLDCPSSPLCLDWREICDGVQRCENGTDEENCDKLEFNECEDDEFRCINGMCIAEEFWLDGECCCFISK